MTFRISYTRKEGNIEISMSREVPEGNSPERIYNTVKEFVDAKFEELKKEFVY